MVRRSVFWMGWLLLAAGWRADAAEPPSSALPPVAKAVLKVDETAENLLAADAWRPWKQGFVREGDTFVCDNGADAAAQRGVGQTVRLDQTSPEPIVATAESRAEGVTGSADNDYAIYLDLSFQDGDHLWGQAAPFSTDSHDWQRRQVVVVPEKPVKSLSFYMLLRGHGGKAWFREPRLRVAKTPAGACTFDGVPVALAGPAAEGFQIRDVAAGSDFVRIDSEALGLKLDCRTTTKPGDDGNDSGVTLFDVTLQDTTGRDRAVTLLYAVPVAPDGLAWLHDPRRSVAVEPGREYVNATTFRVGANGRLSRYPLAAVANGRRGVALGIDMMQPAFYRAATTRRAASCFWPTTSASRPRSLRPGCDSAAMRSRRPAASAVRWSVTTRSFPSSFAPRPRAARGTARVCGCPSSGSAGSRAGRISASSSRRATTKRRGTTSTASSPSATPSR